jgi:hypothetical protein
VFGEDAHAEYTPGAALPDPDHNISSRLSYAFFRLADQRIAMAEQAPVNHSANLIAQRAGTTPDVRIIQLRTKTRHSGDSHHTVDWSHRWVVQMHKVRQWYPSATEQDHPAWPPRQGTGREAVHQRRSRPSSDTVNPAVGSRRTRPRNPHA